jgi:hypothetical protein
VGALLLLLLEGGVGHTTPRTRATLLLLFVGGELQEAAGRATRIVEKKKKNKGKGEEGVIARFHQQ